MKIAFMVTAYVDPEQLARLIKALSTKDRDFYIHIDAKIDITPFRSGVAALHNENVFFIKDEDRVAVYWGGYSQIQSQLALMKTILESGVEYERIVHITGTDYPLWTNGEIDAYFESRRDTEFIMGYEFEKAKNPIRKYKVSRYWFFDYRKYPGFRYIEPMVKHIANLFSGQKVALIKKSGYSLYYGSEYWALTRECLEYVYSTYINDRVLQKLMETSFVPSEIYVQTILYNSKYKDKLFGSPDYNVDRVSRLTPLHYFLYEERIQEFDEHDLPMLLFFDKMFFRKARTGISDKLMDTIDAMREGDSVHVKVLNQ